MPLALVCNCGARLEIDDKFAGQTINCPDCQKPLQAPTVQSGRRRTSGLALTSIILALVLAFTVVGTLAAVVVGILALLQISRHQDHLAGRGFAIAGIVIGVVMTVGTVLAVSSFELFGLSGLMSDAQWSGKLDYPAGLEVVRDNEGFAIKRPSEQWGVFRPPPSKHGDDLDHWVVDDLLLVLPKENAVILCFSQRVGRDTGIAKCKDDFLKAFRDMHKVGLTDKPSTAWGKSQITVNDSKWPPKKDKIEMVELLIDRKTAGEDKSFFVRILKRDDDDRMFVVICGVKRGQMHRLDAQFREALDSFRLLDKDRW